MMRNRWFFSAYITIIVVCVATTSAHGQPLANPKHVDSADPFHPIDAWLPTPSSIRTAAGTPGTDYWQQRADYSIDVTLDDSSQSIEGSCQITYHNRSPQSLPFLWLQLDQNSHRRDSLGHLGQTAPGLAPRTSFDSVRSLLASAAFDVDFQIRAVVDDEGKPLPHQIYDTMMRVGLAAPLQPNTAYTFHVDYRYNVIDAEVVRSRAGYEYFPDDKNYIYEIAQWYPRMAAMTDYAGWQHDPYFGAGEFTLEFGDFDVRITTSADLVVAATGTLTNPDEVLKPEWRERLAKTAGQTKPTFIITPEEAKQNESVRTTDTKSWAFHATNVRDFAFAASRKFIWDAMPVETGDSKTMAMSFYPNEAQPLWGQYSTEAVAHALQVYSRYTFDYPYEVAINVNGPVYGMEYPMICFCSPRPEKDGTYSESTKRGLISVTVHEVGHNYFPMVVNSDEREWTWMDEGLNTFLQGRAEQEWEKGFPADRSTPGKIVSFMRGTNQRPIMTSSDEILQFGANAYAKPSVALTILRESILTREQFDFAFKHYANTWKFKRPTPADFFRAMEDAAGTELDWFWRGWFYSTDHVDLAIDRVELFVIDDSDPDAAKERQRVEEDSRAKTPREIRDEDLNRRVDLQPGLKDFYKDSLREKDQVEPIDREAYEKFLKKLDAEERAILKRTTKFYVVTLKNVGGLPMPVPIQVHYEDGSAERVDLPAQIWRLNSKEVKKLLMSEKGIVRLEIDPQHEIADADEANNHWPPKLTPTRFKLTPNESSKNPMQKSKEASEKEATGS